MICGIGIDSVEIERCAAWKNYSTLQLERIFSVNEINYCFGHSPSTTQRLAAHFAVKEASYKALHSAYPALQLPFLTFCKLVELAHLPNHAPLVSIAWEDLQNHNPAVLPLKTHVSITHTQAYAMAVVILEKERD